MVEKKSLDFSGLGENLVMSQRLSQGVKKRKFCKEEVHIEDGLGFIKRVDEEPRRKVCNGRTVDVMEMHTAPNSADLQQESAWNNFLPQRNLKVLLVEDDDSTRHVVAALLRKCGYEVTPAASGLQGWEILETSSTRVDLVLTDVVMPGLSGIGLLGKIMNQETCKQVPVVMMSCLDSMGVVYKCLSKGAVDFLVKPVRRNELKNLWQHVWRKCLRSSGNGSGGSGKTQGRDGIGSNEGSENGSSGLNAGGGSDNGSGTQSSWTKRAEREVESPRRHGDGNVSYLPPELHSQTEPVSNRNASPDRKFPAEESAQNPTNVRGSFTEAGNEEPSCKIIDLLGSITCEQAGAGTKTNADPGISASNSLPTLELSLRRSRVRNGEEEEKNCVLRHSGGSAFSRYCSSGSGVAQKNQPSCSHSIKPHVSAGLCLGAPGGRTGAFEEGSCEASPQHTEIPDSVIGSSEGFLIPKDATPAVISHSSNPSSGIVTYDKGTGSYSPQLRRVYYPYPAAAWSDDRPRHVHSHHHHHHHHVQHHVHHHSSREKQTGSTTPRGSSNFLDANHGQSGSSNGCGNGGNRSVSGSVSGSNNNSNPVRLVGAGYGAAGNDINGNNGVSSGNETSGAGVVAAACPETNRMARREAALTKFRQKRKERCFEKKVRYQSRKKLAEQRPRVRGQFVRQSVASRDPEIGEDDIAENENDPMDEQQQ